MQQLNIEKNKINFTCRTHE